MEEPNWAKVGYPKIDYQDIHYYAAPKRPAPKSLDDVDPELLAMYEKLGIPLKERAILAGVEGAVGAGMDGVVGAGNPNIAIDAVFDSVSVATTFRESLAKVRRDLLPDQRGGARPSRAGAQVSRQRGAGVRQLFLGAEQRGVHRRVVRVHPQGRALPDGAEHLFPHQCAQHRAVRAHADRGRGWRLRQLPRGLHGAAARREPVARGRGGAGRVRRRDDQVQHGAELVSGRCERPGRDLQLRHQAGRLPRRAQQGELDAGRDRQRDHLEIPELHPAGRRQRG